MGLREKEELSSHFYSRKELPSSIFSGIFGSLCSASGAEYDGWSYYDLLRISSRSPDLSPEDPRIGNDPPRELKERYRWLVSPARSSRMAQY
jgi:hypothetical protein